MAPQGDPFLNAGSMAEVLRARADATPDRRAFCFLPDGEEEGPRLTYGELDRAARAVAAALRDGAGPGDRVLLLYERGLEFVAAFFGCQYAGLVPVPASPPRLDRLAQSWEAMANVAADCRPRFALTTADLAPGLTRGLANRPGGEGLRWLATDRVDLSGAGRWREPPASPEATTLLQYTSGSTAAPRGVEVTHRNLMHNERMIQAALEHSGEGLGVSWLPLYHDLGLIGGVLQAVFHGAPAVLMPPLAMVQRPLRWLRAVARYRADTSGGPNFAYDLCVQRITPEEKAGLDLSHWSIACLGSEPVSAATLRRQRGVRPVRLPARSVLPLLRPGRGDPVRHRPPQGRRPGRPHREYRRPGAGPGRGRRAGRAGLAHAGGLRPAVAGAAGGHRDPRHVPAPAGRGGGGGLGRRPSVARGYWGRPDETRRTFGARPADGEGPFLRTGDLGFMREGQLFVTGRLKDVLVVRGRNHYPEDIEATVQAAHPALRPGGGAAFETGPDGQPRVVVVQEIDRRARGLSLAAQRGDVRQAVAQRHDLQVHDVQFLQPGALPRTSSGKVQRHACRAAYERGALRLWREG